MRDISNVGNDVENNKAERILMGNTDAGSLQTCGLKSLADGLNIFFRVNGFTGYPLLAPDDLIFIPAAEIRNNHEILSVR